jgi:hypothetical protein
VCRMSPAAAPESIQDCERMTKILLIRHGHVEGIKPERFRGREPLELTDQDAPRLPPSQNALLVAGSRAVSIRAP